MLDLRDERAILIAKAAYADARTSWPYAARARRNVPIQPAMARPISSGESS